MSIRAAIYARVSTRDKGQDTENQLAQLRAFAAARSWTLAHEYIDRASGKTAARDEFQQLFTDASRRNFDVVLVWALDRLTREGVMQTFEHVKRLKSHGVEFISLTEEHFRTTGPAGELMIAIAAWIAQQERQRISERVHAGLERAKRQGKAIGRPRAIFDRTAVCSMRDAGLSWRQIAAKLDIGVGTTRRAYERKPAGKELCQNRAAVAAG